MSRQYIDAVNAGASLIHHHGVHHLEKEMQADGKKLSKIDFDGWRRLTELILAEVDPIVQFGIASARLEEKIRLMTLGPDMMSYAFNVHDEYFRPDPAYPANEMYSLHPRDELEAFSRAALEHGVKPEVESFYTGAFWNLEFIRQQGLLEDPVWTTLFLGWQGGAWTPPTHESLLYLVHHLPPRRELERVGHGPDTQWKLLPLAIAMGGHVRVGWEDNPYLPDGTLTDAQRPAGRRRRAHGTRDRARGGHAGRGATDRRGAGSTLGRVAESRRLGGAPRKPRPRSA